MPRVQPPSDAEFDFEIRPKTYWPETPTEATVLGQVKGAVRRQAAANALQQGGEPPPDGAVEFMLRPDLTEEEREMWGRMHPSHMGGEYLPAMLPGEVEIANIALLSVTGDVIQVRARPLEGGIAFRVVDEYEAEGSEYAIEPERAGQPLSMGELVDLIDSADPGEQPYGLGLVEPPLVANLEGCDPDDLAGFVTVTSAFYPQLGAYYEARANAVLDEARLREDE
jgi:hypothetical protein